jgi:endonuclease YncB( thermonuclease family)
MGWRAWDRYETDAHKRWQALPWRERFPLRVILPLALLAAFVASFVYSTVARGAPIDPKDVHVVDGDTIRLFHKRPDVRLVGFNAPETDRAMCAAEGELSAKATRRLRDLVRAGGLDFQFIQCSCRPGTQGTFACNYGRSCGTLKAKRRDVGEILIAENLAVAFQCGQRSCPRTPRPWCN